MSESRPSSRPSLLKRRYIVNPKVQFTIMGVMIFVAMASTIAFYIAQGIFFDQFSSIADGLHYPATHPFRQFIITQKGIFSTFFVYATLANLVLIALMGMFLSHRIVGPVFRITNSLEAIVKGDASAQITIRKNDCFQELPIAINKAMDKVKNG